MKCESLMKFHKKRIRERIGYSSLLRFVRLNFSELEERGIVKERRSVDGERRFIEVLDPEALIRVLEERGVI